MPLSPEQQRLVEENLDMPLLTARVFVRRSPWLKRELEELEALGRLGLVQAAAKYDSGMCASFRTYAFVAIRNEIIGYIRRRFPRAFGAAHDVIYDQLVQSELPSMASQRAVDELWQEVAAVLSPPDQELIALRYAQELAVADVGKRLGIRTQAAQQRLHRAVRRLQRAYATGSLLIDDSLLARSAREMPVCSIA